MNQSRDSESLGENALSPQRAWQYVLIDQGLVAIVVNFAINWGIAWGVFRGMETVPLHGDLSIVGDTFATCWMLPLISCLIVTALTRNEIRKGRIPPLRTWHWPSTLMSRLAKNLPVRAALWGLAGAFLLAPVVLWGLERSGLESLPLQQFLLAKATFASAIGIFFCPFHAWVALHDGVSPQNQDLSDISSHRA